MNRQMTHPDVKFQVMEGQTTILMLLAELVGGVAIGNSNVDVYF
jgi:hypothetical protein